MLEHPAPCCKSASKLASKSASLEPCHSRSAEAVGWLQPLLLQRSALDTVSNRTVRAATAQSQQGPQEPRDWKLAAQVRTICSRATVLSTWLSDMNGPDGLADLSE